MTLLVSQVKHAHSTSEEGLSVFALDGLALNTLMINGLIDENKSIAITINSEFSARGTEPKVDIRFYKDQSLPVLLRQASVVIDQIVYYRPEGGKNVEVGTYFRRLTVNPKNYTEEILYEIDFKESMDEVVNYFSAKVTNLTREQVGLAGRLSIEARFENATGIVSNNGYLRFIPTFDGNMTSITLDLTVPEDYELTSYKIGDQDMTKVFPNRVQRRLSVTQGQGTSTELYLEWKIPVPPPPPPIYDVPPWRWIIPGLIGVCLTIIIRDIIPRLWKRALEALELLAAAVDAGGGIIKL